MPQAPCGGTLEVVRLVTLVVQAAVDAVEHRRASDFCAVAQRVPRKLIANLLGHDLLIAAQTRALLHREVLSRLLREDPGLVTGDEQVVLARAELRHDLAVLALLENLADLTVQLFRLLVETDQLT